MTERSDSTELPGLRLARPSDAEGVCAIYAPYVRGTSISFELEVPSTDEMGRRIAAVQTRFPWLVYDEDGAGTLTGYAYASEFRARAAYRFTCEVSVYIAEDARGRGLGRTLYAALFRVLQRQGMRTLIGGATLPNDASARLHESFGFQPVGVFEGIGYKRDAWHDVGFWSLDLHATTSEAAAPDEPRTLSELVAAGELPALLRG